MPFAVIAKILSGFLSVVRIAEELGFDRKKLGQAFAEAAAAGRDLRPEDVEAALDNARDAIDAIGAEKAKPKKTG